MKITAIVVGGSTGGSVDTQLLARLREKRRTDGVVSMSEDEHQDLLELEREQAELGHARWAATQVRDYLARVVADGGDIQGGGGWIRTAVVKQGKPRLDAAVELAADGNWTDIQLTKLRVKPRLMSVAKAHLNTLVVRMIEREVVANG